MIKRLIAFFVALLFFIVPIKSFAASFVISVSAASCILIDANTKEVLFSKNENVRRGIASTTKILTSLIALETGDFYKEVVATEEAVRVEGTSIGLKSGDPITIKALVYAMLLESGNDAANTTAIAISGSIEKFADLMNSYAKKLGMKNSQFKNPSGLTEEGHFSTAYDMALLTINAIKNPIFSKISATRTAVVDFGKPSVSRSFSNHNRLLFECEGVFGVKTGYTRASGRCLVSAAKRNGATLVCVTLNAYDDWNDHKKLYDYGFSLFETREVQIKPSVLKIPVVSADVPFITVKPPDFVEMNVLKTASALKTEIYIEGFLYPPVKKGDVVGRLVIKNSDNIKILEIPLASENSAAPLCYQEESISMLQKIKNFIKKWDRR